MDRTHAGHAFGLSAHLVATSVLLGCGASSTVEVDDARVVSEVGSTDAPGGTDASASDASPALDAPRIGYGAPFALGTLTGIPETSGIVASRDHAGVFWIHNDSGNPAEIYAIDREARVRATITLEGAMNQDWEDIAIVPVDGVDLLYVGDHGDNEARTSDGATSSRSGSVRLYRVEEPDPAAGDARVAAAAIELVYPDGPHDCEAMFVAPGSGDVFLLAKVDRGTAGVYRASAPSLTAPNVLERVATFDMRSITAADMSSDGARLAVRSYTQVRVYEVEGEDIAAALAATPARPAFASPAEAIAFGPVGWDLFTIAEGDPATLFELAWE